MRKALDLLENEHLLTRRQGRGTFVNDQSSDELAVRFCNVRKPDGNRIVSQFRDVALSEGPASDMERTRLQLAPKDQVYRVTRIRMDNNRPFIKEAGMCKLLGSEYASRCVDRAVQIHGALGYSRDTFIERGFRDSRIAEIFEGTNEIQRILIAEQMFREVGVKIRP
jgi:alkylation response protein AidB-like acyl-CoA dehydrogenase